MDTAPRLSIGLPVYNGENYLAAALGGFVDQTFTDFELIVCDNASTDRTEEICRAFAAADERVRYHRNPENLGAAPNYNLTVELARAPCFKWAAHDDICLPGYLARCMEVMDNEPDVVLCHTLSDRIDENGRITGRYADEVEAVDADPAQRFWRVIGVPHYCIPIFGVVRKNVLQATPMHGSYTGADRNLLAELALHGRIRLAPEPLFQRRDHGDSSITRFRDERARLAWFDSGSKGDMSYPTWRRAAEYVASIRRAPLQPRQRLDCALRLARWTGARHHTGPVNAFLMLKELGGPVRSAFARVPGRRSG